MGHGTDKNNDTNNSSTFCPIIQKSGIGLEGNEGWTYPEDKKSAITYNITEVGKMISFTRSTLLKLRETPRGPRTACKVARSPVAGVHGSGLQPCQPPQQPCAGATARAGVPSTQNPSSAPRLYSCSLPQLTGFRMRRERQTMRTPMGMAQGSQGSAG